MARREGNKNQTIEMLGEKVAAAMQKSRLQQTQ